MAGIISYGQSGDAVKGLQQQLNNAGYKIAVDGQFGNQTLNALKQFQKQAGISVDGLAGNQTFGALSKYGQPQQQAPSTPQTPQQPQPSSQDWLSQFKTGIDNQLQGYMNQLQQSNQSGLNGILADLQKQRDDAIAGYNTDYANQYSLQQQAQNQANTDYTQANDQINHNAYIEAQRTAASGEARGIGNSQQMLGLQQNDMNQKSSQINLNTQNRDKQLADIATRIAALQQTRDQGILKANQDFSSGSVSAKQKALSDLQTAMANAQLHGFDVYNQEASSLHNADMDNQYKLGQMAKQHQYSQQDAAQQEQYTLQNMSKQQGYDLQKIAQQASDARSLESIRNNHQLQQIQAQANAQAKADQSAYEASLRRAQAQYTPGTPEYKLAQAKAQADYLAQSKASQEAFIQKTLSALYADPKTRPQPPSSPPPTAPKDFGSVIYDLGLNGERAKYDSAMNKYKTDLAKWQVYQKFIQNPTSVTLQDFNNAQ